MSTEITAKTIETVVGGFFGGTFTRGDVKTEQLHLTCLELFKRDSECIVVSNADGVLCGNYPSRLIIPVQEVSTPTSQVVDTDADDVDVNQRRNRPCTVCGAHGGAAESHDDDDDDELVEIKRCDSDIVVPVDVDIPSLKHLDGQCKSNVSTEDSAFETPDEEEEGVADAIPPPACCPSCSKHGTHAKELQELFQLSCVARTRCRFVVPVMQVHGKNICRSGTLARQCEVVVREAWNRVRGPSPMGLSAEYEKKQEMSASMASVPEANGDTVAVYRRHDIALLEKLGVRYICDLMVEDKKVKFGVELTSSEKVDKQRRYASGFDICVMPYPGCELFTDFKKRNYCATSVLYDWDGDEVNARLNIPLQHMGHGTLDITWADYRQWNLVLLTQNYMRLLLRFLSTDNDASGKGGLLVHCISGWDRTPLFVSLLRMSLWADGQVHPSLSAEELLYLTITYDWLLFGHCLVDRVGKDEEIMLFCFDFLQFLEADEFAFPGLTNLVDTNNVSDKACSSTCTPIGILPVQADPPAQDVAGPSAVSSPPLSANNTNTLPEIAADMEYTPVGEITAGVIECTPGEIHVTCTQRGNDIQGTTTSVNKDVCDVAAPSLPLAYPSAGASSKPIAIANGSANRRARAREARTQASSFGSPASSPNSFGSWHMLSPDNLKVHGMDSPGQRSLDRTVAASLSDSPRARSMSACSTTPPDATDGNEGDNGDASDDDDVSTYMFDDTVFYSACEPAYNGNGAGTAAATTACAHGDSGVCSRSSASPHRSTPPSSRPATPAAPAMQITPAERAPSLISTAQAPPRPATARHGTGAQRDTGAVHGSVHDTVGCMCMCNPCVGHRRGAFGGAAGGSVPTARAQRLRALRTMFLPMYRRCQPLAHPQGGKAVWGWMSQLLPGKAA